MSYTNGTLYIGITNDMDRHLIEVCSCIKQWKHFWKTQLIAEHNPINGMMY